MSMTRKEVQDAIGFYRLSELPRHRAVVELALDLDARLRAIEDAGSPAVELSPAIQAAIDKAVEERVAAAIAAAKAAKPGPKAREDLQGDSVRSS